MLKLLFISAVALLAKADQKDFPEMDAKHPHCQIQVDYPSRTCDWEYNRFEMMIKNFGGEDPGHGKYDVKEKGTNYIWTVRTSADGKQVHDVIYYFDQQSNTCKVTSKSRQRDEAALDKNASYCSAWYVLKYSDSFEAPNVSNCIIVPAFPDTDCVKYVNGFLS